MDVDKTEDSSSEESDTDEEDVFALELKYSEEEIKKRNGKRRDREKTIAKALKEGGELLKRIKTAGEEFEEVQSTAEGASVSKLVGFMVKHMELQQAQTKAMATDQTVQRKQGTGRDLEL